MCIYLPATSKGNRRTTIYKIPRHKSLCLWKGIANLGKWAVVFLWGFNWKRKPVEKHSTEPKQHSLRYWAIPKIYLGDCWLWKNRQRRNTSWLHYSLYLKKIFYPRKSDWLSQQKQFLLVFNLGNKKTRVDFLLFLVYNIYIKQHTHAYGINDVLFGVVVSITTT